MLASVSMSLTITSDIRRIELGLSLPQTPFFKMHAFDMVDHNFFTNCVEFYHLLELSKSDRGKALVIDQEL